MDQLVAGCAQFLCFSTIAFAGQKSLEVKESPESVTRGFDGKLFVSLMGVEKKAGDRDGGVAVVDGDKVKVFVDGMDDPKGIVMFGGGLVTTDRTKIWKVDRQGNKEVFVEAADFPVPPIFLNDIALAPDKESILVTDMGAMAKMADPETGKLWELGSEGAEALPVQGRVFRVNLEGEVTEEIAPNPAMKCPNGVDFLADGTIRVAAFFNGTILEQEGDGFKVLAEGHRTADAIVHDSKGRFYVSEVGTGRVARYEADGTGQTELGEGLKSAADMIVDEANGQLIIPDTASNQLVFISL